MADIILLLIIESVMRRDISIHIKERIYQTAFVFLLLFAVGGHLQRPDEGATGAGAAAAVNRV